MANKEITTKEELKHKLISYLDSGANYIDFAEDVGVSKWKVYKFVKGIRHILDIDDAVKIAEGLGYQLKFEKK